MFFVKKTFLWKNLTLVYYDNEQRSDTVWLLAHANGYAALCYRFFWEKLHLNHCRFIALDFAGHGFSQGSLQFCNWDFYRDQLEALANSLTLSKIIGLGHSMGAAVLLRFASRYPEKFAAVIGLDPTLLSWPVLLYSAFFPVPIAQKARRRRRYFESKEKAAKILRRTPAFSEWSEEAFAGYLEACLKESEHGGVKLSCSPELEAKNFQSVGAFSLLQYRPLPIPVHFLLPLPSEVCPYARAKRIASKHPQSTVQRLAHFNHLFPFTHPEETWQLITKLPGVPLPHPHP